MTLRRISLSVVLLCLSANAASAECVGLTLKNYVKYAAVIFRGVVEETTPVPDAGAMITLRVSRVWKGKVDRRVVLHQPFNIDGCYWGDSPVGTEHLIFASPLRDFEREWFHLQAGGLAVPQCGAGTVPIANAATILKELGRGHSPK